MNKIIERIEKTEIVIAAIGICVSCVLIFASAIFRTFGKPINWAQDFSLLIFAWSVFFGADVALRKDKLVRVELFTDKMSERVKAILKLLVYLIIAAFLVYSIYYGVILSKKTARRVFQGISWLSYTWVTVSYPIASFLMLITTAFKIKDAVCAIKGGMK